MLVTMIIGLFALTAGAVDPLFFEANDAGLPPADVPINKPWKIVTLNPDYGGQWVVASDLNADGEVEFVACENHNVGDVHYTSTAVAQDLDGTVLWRWGDPNIGRKEWHHDVACQIHDWDGDGKPEVILATKGAKGRPIAIRIHSLGHRSYDPAVRPSTFVYVPERSFTITRALPLYPSEPWTSTRSLRDYGLIAP